MLPAIIIDVESTGKSPREDQVIELAYLPQDNNPGRIHQNPFVKQYKPTIPIKLGALAVSHILEKDLETCDDHSKALTDIPFAQYWIGHNVKFDWEILGSPDVRRIDLLPIARNLFPALDSHTQSALIYFIGIGMGKPERARERLKNAHSAGDDVSNCNTVLSFLLKQAEKCGIDVSTWEKVWEFSEECRVPPICYFGKHKGNHWSTVDEGFRGWYYKQDNQNQDVLDAFEKYPYEG